VTAGAREPLVVCLGAFLVAFALTRLYTRLARVRGWGSASAAGGVHLHHMVVGILFILVTGLVTVAFWPEGRWSRDVIALFFGVGAALTLDEFALWLYLRDVYWCEEGRSSIDATLWGVVLACLLLVGTSPFGAAVPGDGMREIAFAMISFNVIVAVITFLKGKLLFGVISVFVPIVGIVTAIRLAKPRSLWAKYVYRTRNPSKLERARRRYEDPRSWNRRIHAKFDDLVGGAPMWVTQRMPVEVVAGRLVMSHERPPAAEQPIASTTARAKRGTRPARERALELPSGETTGAREAMHRSRFSCSRSR
jgi:hypothetical protein